MQLAVGSCMPFCRCQKVLLCLSLLLLPAAGTVWKFVAKSVYWFAMCNSHSMKIELFLWLLIGFGSREGVGIQGRIQCVCACKATASLDASKLGTHAASFGSLTATHSAPSAPSAPSAAWPFGGGLLHIN